MNDVKLLVPASTSNLGPGFDALGLALDWHLKVTASRHASGLSIKLSGSGPGPWEEALRAMVTEAVIEWEKRSGQGSPGLELSIAGDIPLARGLGSSAAYRVAAAAAANALADHPLSEPEILELVCRLEKHTDNATPCMKGGLTVSGWMEDRVHYAHYPVPERFRFVALIPDLEMETSKARSVLPETVPRSDAVFNMQRAVWLVSAIANNRPEALRGVFQDRLHQPFREKLLPFLPSVISAAEAAGAYGAFLSGSGSTIMAVTDELKADAVAKSMKEAAGKKGNKGGTRVLKPDNQGLKPIFEG